MTTCNACRYCEGYCAVFPAMERRRSFTPADLNYLANLCHDCGECYYACQYAPPHEFAVNVPLVLAQIRVQSYRQYAFPALLNRYALSFAIVVTIAALLTGIIFAGAGSAGDFYRVVPHGTMVAIYGTAATAVLLALVAGFVRFWRESGERLSTIAHFSALKTVLKDVLTLEYLRSGGVGCPYPDEHH
jgi:citrate/tricarballylate utilization protein